jgi:hypothetical protein
VGLTSGNKEKKKQRCGLCDKKCTRLIYATRSLSVWFGGAHGSARSGESIKTVYFCNYDHRLKYTREALDYTGPVR